MLIAIAFMPAIRATRKFGAQTSHNPLVATRTYASPPQTAAHTPACDSDPSTATVRSLGPLADQDERLKGRTKTSAREINNARLWEAVERVAPRSPQHVKEHKPGHRLLKPRLCYGFTNPGKVENVGKWYQKVCNSALALAYH